jgi:hypothetical protein
LQVAAEGFDRTPVIKAKLGVREQVIPELVRHPQRDRTPVGQPKLCIHQNHRHSVRRPA